ncbi:MAG TPA: hypothetical protein VFA53_06695 [Xanthobacteraceae bacterium]|nr:hypothetical protein [Xanthobacteraceae bacterium]
MKKSVVAVLAAGFAAAVLAGPALAAKVDKVDAKSITIGGKTYKTSNKRTKVMINGAAGKLDAIKVGMDCTAKGGDEASEIDCK